MEAKLSLVFPCYHAAQHMQHVLEDLQAQTFADFEAILVNDGDDSQVEAMEQIAAQDSRIRIVYRSENGGVAAARNSGTEAVTTQWVTYPDPDDRFGPNYTKSLYEAVDGTGVELACGGFKKFFVDSGKERSIRLVGADSLTIMEMAMGYGKMEYSGVSLACWNKLYKLEVIRREGLYHDISFQRGQDVPYNFNYFHHVRKVALIGDCDYIYYIYDNNKSNSSVYIPDVLQKELEILSVREMFYHHIGWTEQRIGEFRKHELANIVHYVFKNHLQYANHLSIREAAAKMKEDVFDQPEMVEAILRRDTGKDWLMQLEKFLVRLGNPMFATVTYKFLLFVKNCIGNNYERLKPVLRGE